MLQYGGVGGKRQELPARGIETGYHAPVEFNPDQRAFTVALIDQIEQIRRSSFPVCKAAFCTDDLLCLAVYSAKRILSAQMLRQFRFGSKPAALLQQRRDFRVCLPVHSKRMPLRVTNPKQDAPVRAEIKQKRLLLQ